MRSERQLRMLQIHDHLIHFQRERRRIAVLNFAPDTFYGEAVTLSEAHALERTQQAGSTTNSDLVRHLGLEKSSVSRLVQGLRRRRLVQGERAVLLTAAGREIVDRLADNKLRSLELLFEGVSRSTVNQFATAVVQLSGSVDGEKRCLSPNDATDSLTEIGGAFAKFTRAFGFTGASYFGYPLTYIEYQLLESTLIPGNLRMKQLLDELPYPEGVVRRVLGGLISNGYIERSRYRNPTLNMTESGAEVYQQCRLAIIRTLHSWFADLSQVQLDRIADTLMRMRVATLAGRVEIRAVRQHERSLARYLFASYTMRHQLDFPEQVYSSASSIEGVWRGEELLASAEHLPNGQVCNFACSEDFTPATGLTLLLTSAARELTSDVLRLYFVV